MTTSQRQRIEKVCGKNFEASDVPPAWRGGKTVDQLNAELDAEKDSAKMDQMEEMDHFDGIIHGEDPEEEQ